MSPSLRFRWPGGAISAGPYDRLLLSVRLPEDPVRRDDNDTRSAKAGVPRARMYMAADLAWLRGFPIGQSDSAVEWVHLAAGDSAGLARLTVSRELLRRAQLTQSRLVNRFPEALPKIVGNVARWSERVDRVLSLLKAAIHDQARLPANLFALPEAYPAKVVRSAKRLQTNHPAIEHLIAAISWRTWMEPDATEQALAWLEAEADALGGLLKSLSGSEGICLAVTLWEMARHAGAPQLSWLLKILGDPRAFAIPVIPPENYIRGWIRFVGGLTRKSSAERQEPAAETAHAGKLLVALIHRTVLQPARVRNRTWQIAEMLLPGKIIRDIWHPWTRVNTVIQGIRSRLHHEAHFSRYERQALCRAHCENLQSLLDLDFSSPPLKKIVDWIEFLSEPGQQRLHSQIVRTLARMPPLAATAFTTNRQASFRSHKLLPRLLPVEFVKLWVGLARSHGAAPVELLIRHFDERLVSAGRNGTAFGDRVWNGSAFSWQALLACFESCLSWPGIPRAKWPLYFQVLRELADTGEVPVTELDVERLVEIVIAADCGPAAITLFRSLSEHSEYASSKLLRQIRPLTDDGADLVPCVRWLRRFEDRPEMSVLASVTQQLHARGWHRACARLINSRQFAPLEKLARIAALLHERSPPLPVSALDSSDNSPPAWITEYPVALRAALVKLASVHPRAEKAAERQLDDALPTQQRLATEIAAIEQRLLLRPDDLPLSRRLASLRARRAQAREVPPSRLARLEDKVELAAARQLFANWTDRVTTSLKSELATRLGVVELPDWILGPKVLGALGAVSQLSAAYQRIATRLLRRRLGPPPWDLRDDPANQRFLAAMKDRGINMEPWFNPQGATRVTACTGRPLLLALEQDPLEILQMGDYFETCLSSYGVNFFSAVTNAADVNKRVLFARSPQGELVGRCLLALTGDGELLGFRPYYYDTPLKFEDLAGKFVRDLAAQMRTRVVADGIVPTLVAPEWYNDGPYDLSGMGNTLNDPQFSASLETVTLDEFVPALERACAPAPLDGWMLARVVMLPCLTNRPELILPLLPRLEAGERLPTYVLWQAAVLAHRAGSRRFARRVLHRGAIPDLIRQPGTMLWEEAVDVLAAIDPSSALRVLRGTRPNGVRNDESELSRQRRSLLAAAHENLGRSALAGRLRGPPQRGAPP